MKKGLPFFQNEFVCKISQCLFKKKSVAPQNFKWILKYIWIYFVLFILLFEQIISYFKFDTKKVSTITTTYVREIKLLIQNSWCHGHVRRILGWFWNMFSLFNDSQYCTRICTSLEHFRKWWINNNTEFPGDCPSPWIWSLPTPSWQFLLTSP